MWEVLVKNYYFHLTEKYFLVKNFFVCYSYARVFETIHT